MSSRYEGIDQKSNVKLFVFVGARPPALPLNNTACFARSSDLAFASKGKVRSENLTQILRTI